MLIAELAIATITRPKYSEIACLKIENFAKKPGNGGIPANDNKHTVNIMAIKGERLPNPLKISKPEDLL